jgi:hypothetical protein
MGFKILKLTFGATTLVAMLINHAGSEPPGSVCVT